MGILVTGGAGFLGQCVITKILESDPGAEVTCFDTVTSNITHPRLRSVTGTITEPGVAHSLVAHDTRTVIHLAAVVSGSAEADFDLGMRVNLDGTIALLEACRSAGTVPRMVFPSSVAVFGGDLPSVVTDATNPTPQSSYGTQKRIGELLMQDYTRKGFIDGRSIRIPTVAVRPGRPNGAASGFASSLIREPLAGQPAVLPVPRETAMWIASPRAVTAMILHAMNLPPEAWGWDRCLNLPGITVTMAEEINALTRVAPSAVGHIREVIDPAVVAVVATWATRFVTARAEALGFIGDSSITDVIDQYIADNPDAIAHFASAAPTSL